MLQAPTKSFSSKPFAVGARLDPANTCQARPDHEVVLATWNLPPGLVLAGHFTGQLRAFLDAHGLRNWDVYFLNSGALNDVDFYLTEIGEPDGRWEPHSDHFNGGEQPGGLSCRGGDENAVTVSRQPSGFLWLKGHEIVVARWFRYDLGHDGWTPLHLFAAPSPRPYVRLRDRLLQLRRDAAQNVWQVVTGEAWRDERIDRDPAHGWDDLILDPAVRQRLAAEVGNFFRESVANLYRELNIPYRRGLLLYGPPGNGKTSLVRVIGNVNPDIPGFLLRPGENFDDNALKTVISRWREQAPAILVIEDLDWLFHSARLNVSTFLNMLDGVDRRDGGLLLIATSNHPESLDPAINNRPGRFDVAVEVTCPDAAMRTRFFQRGGIAAVCGPRAFHKLVSATDGLSFSHLREIESQSGLSAVQEGRATRTERDVLQAAERVVRTHDEARRGFPEPITPFGLGLGRGRTGA